MRKIKFRAKRLYDGEWISGDLHLHTPFPHIHSTRGDKAKIDRNTICQFTGLRDKNGKDIYEGDIISHKYTIGPQCCFSEEEINYIGFRQSECKFIVVCANRHHDLYEPYNIYIEVIGNIYDNPELLKSFKSWDGE